MNNSFINALKSILVEGYDVNDNIGDNPNEAAFRTNLTDNAVKKIAEHPHTTNESLLHLSNSNNSKHSVIAMGELARRKVKGMDLNTATLHLNHGNANEHEVLAIAKKHPQLRIAAINHRNGWLTAHDTVTGALKHNRELSQAVHDKYPNEKSFTNAIKNNNHDQFITFKH